jgi:hypothetical protein
MVAACTSQANETNGFEATYNFLIAFEVDAKRRRRLTGNGYVAFGDFGRKVVIGFIPIRVICEPPSKHIALPPVPFKVTGAELYLATFKGDGPVPWFLDKTTHAQFFVQETEGLGVSAGWKDIDITCGNNLADPTSQPPSDQPDLRVLKSKFTVTTFQNDSATGCPVNAALDVELITNKPGGVPFKVTSTDGFVWNFSIKADEEFGPLQIGDGQAQFAKTYRAKYRRMLQVAKSTDAQYSLEVRNVAAEPDAKTAGPDNLKVSCGGDLAVPFCGQRHLAQRRRFAGLPDHGLRRRDVRHQRAGQRPLSPRRDDR